MGSDPISWIPIQRLTVRASRSGGPGGQNVNKVSSRVEVRFPLAEADWIPRETRERLRALFPGRVTAGGEFRVVCQTSRDQGRNLKECLRKLEAFIREASERPRPRIATAPTRSSMERRLRAKRRRSQAKRARGGRDEME